ncbi:hypothetical protein N665_1223s0002 [Sinapis alba]|nr:hypothetical protein N665_1223s0002 [Sinapis alba]
MLVYHLRMANPESMREEMIMTIDIPGKQEEASPVSDEDSESYCAEAVKAEESVIVAKQAMAADRKCSWRREEHNKKLLNQVHQAMEEHYLSIVNAQKEKRRVQTQREVRN